MPNRIRRKRKMIKHETLFKITKMSFRVTDRILAVKGNYVNVRLIL